MSERMPTRIHFLALARIGFAYRNSGIWRLRGNRYAAFQSGTFIARLPHASHIPYTLFLGCLIYLCRRECRLESIFLPWQELVSHTATAVSGVCVVSKQKRLSIVFVKRSPQSTSARRGLSSTQRDLRTDRGEYQRLEIIASNIEELPHASHIPFTLSLGCLIYLCRENADSNPFSCLGKNWVRIPRQPHQYRKSQKLIKRHIHFYFLLYL